MERIAARAEALQSVIATEVAFDRLHRHYGGSANGKISLPISHAKLPRRDTK
jgi:hypothetical protein